MEKSKQSFFTAKNICYLAVLTALVVVLQLWGSAIPIPNTNARLCFVLVPIVLGGMLLNQYCGMFLGFVFGLVVLICGITGVDQFTYYLWVDHPVLTSVLCLVKGMAAGYLSGLLYQLIRKKNGLVAVFVASALAPIVNTGLFILGALLMSDTLSANFVPNGQTVIYFLVIVCAGINFLIEFAINLVLAPALHRVVYVVEKQIRKGK